LKKFILRTLKKFRTWHFNIWVSHELKAGELD
jgi:hypothetical protein